MTIKLSQAFASPFSSNAVSGNWKFGWTPQQAASLSAQKPVQKPAEKSTSSAHGVAYCCRVAATSAEDCAAGPAARYAHWRNYKTSKKRR
jgi:hypothetical protein